MTAGDERMPSEVDIVRSFLQAFYSGEEWEDVAAIQALEAHSSDRRERWRIANAFARVLGAQLPEGLLQELVTTSANREVGSDAEAREFLERAYESNAFDVAVDFDEFEQGE